MGGLFQIVNDVYAEKLLHCGPVDMDGGMLLLLSPEVHNQLLRFVGDSPPWTPMSSL